MLSYVSTEKILYFTNNKYSAYISLRLSYDFLSPNLKNLIHLIKKVFSHSKFYLKILNKTLIRNNVSCTFRFFCF